MLTAADAKHSDSRGLNRAYALLPYPRQPRPPAATTCCCLQLVRTLSWATVDVGSAGVLPGTRRKAGMQM